MRSLSLSPSVCLHAAKLKANFISSWYMLIWKSRCLKCYIGLWISLVNSQRKSVTEITLTKENIFNLSCWDHTKLLENSYIPNERKKYPTKNCVYHIFISQFRGSGDCRRLFIQIIGYKFVPSKKKKDPTTTTTAMLNTFSLRYHHIPRIWLLANDARPVNTA